MSLLLHGKFIMRACLELTLPSGRQSATRLPLLDLQGLRGGKDQHSRFDLILRLVFSMWGVEGESVNVGSMLFEVPLFMLNSDYSCCYLVT